MDAQSEKDAAAHVHFVEPSMDGSCIACVGARRIYCLDGSGAEDGDVNDYKLGSCQPNWSYCTNGGRKDVAALMNYKECYYTDVQSPVDSSFFTSDMIDLEITDEMAQKVMDGEKLTLLDFLFLPD